VDIKEVRSSMFLVSYKADKDEPMPWVPITQLRLSSRRGDGWDCAILRKGMDVSVLSKHPHFSSLKLQKHVRQQPGYLHVLLSILSLPYDVSDGLFQWKVLFCFLEESFGGKE
jgi:hypothetical protein